MEQVPKKKSKFICLKCNRTFNRVQRLQAHQRKPTCGTNCTRCRNKFRTRAQLIRHLKSFVDCDHCDEKFCSDFHLNDHLQTVHSGAGVKDDLSRPIFSSSAFEKEDGYKQIVASYSRYIKDAVQDKNPRYQVINKELSSSFTYKDLEELIRSKGFKSGRAFKLNLGFGCILRDLISGEYRYYYVSNNHLLLHKAFTISKYNDLAEFMNKLVEMDIAEHYYMLRPSSGWILAGIPNVQIKFMFLGPMLG